MTSYLLSRALRSTDIISKAYPRWALRPTNPSISLVRRLLHGSERIIFVFSAYGLVAGLMIVIESMSEQDIFGAILFPMNYPTIIALLWIVGEHYAIPVAIPVWNAMIVLMSIAVWSILGFIIYCFYRLFKLGP